MARIVSIAPGEDLIDALARAVSGNDGSLQANGAVENVELRVAAEGADPVRALRGRWTLASLIGPGGGPFGVTLARSTDAGLEVVAGELVRARSAGVVLAVFAADGAVASRPIAQTAPAASPAPEPPQARVEQKPAQSQWAVSALATAASARLKQMPDEDPIWPGPGDLVQHFAFGLCEVLMAEDDKLKIRDIHGQGRIREIRLEMLDVSPPREKDGKRLFRLERRG